MSDEVPITADVTKLQELERSQGRRARRKARRDGTSGWRVVTGLAAVVASICLGVVAFYSRQTYEEQHKQTQEQVIQSCLAANANLFQATTSGANETQRNLALEIWDHLCARSPLAKHVIEGALNTTTTSP